MSKISRRRAIGKASTIMGTAFSSSVIMGVLAGCKAEATLDWTPQALTGEEIITCIAFAEVILPATSTPGAKEARVERFIDSMVAGYLPESERNMFIKGLAKLNERKFARKKPVEQNAMVTELVAEARAQKQSSDSKPFFLLAKQMILLGFFTSEIGATQVLNYDPIPGGYLGCIPLHEAGGKTWAS